MNSIALFCCCQRIQNDILNEQVKLKRNFQPCLLLTLINYSSTFVFLFKFVLFQSMENSHRMWEIKLLSLFVIWDIEWDISRSQVSILIQIMNLINTPTSSCCTYH